MWLAGGDHSRGVFHRLARTGERVGNGVSFKMSCVLDRSEHLRCEINSSDVEIPALQVSDLNEAVTDHQTCPILPGVSIRKGRMSYGVQVGFWFKGLAKSVGMVKRPGYPRIKRRQSARSKRFSRVKS